jgi:hypothetical protein
MEIGLLWFDDNKDKSLATKVYEAAAAYRAKPRFAGKTPNVCYVHPSTLPEVQETHLNGMRIVAASTVAPHHLFVGVENTGDNGHGHPQQRHRQPRGPKSQTE